MRITKIELKNVRAFRELTIDFMDESNHPRMRTLIIGKNGTCKTSILRSIAFALCDTSQTNAFLQEPIGPVIRSNQDMAEISVEMVRTDDRSEVKTFRTIITSGSGHEIAEHKGDPAPFNFLVSAFGAGRSMSGPETGRDYRIVDSAYSIFNYEATFIDPELTLRRLEDSLGSQQYRKTVTSIQQAMGLTAGDRISVGKSGGVFVSGSTIGKRIPIEAWADGYRVPFNLILDVYAWAMRAGRNEKWDGRVRGVLLIDEVEQHLHPSVQRTSVMELSQLFPEMQIIVTTHSPIVTLGVENSEILALKRMGDSVEAEKWLPDLSSYSYEDVLTDERLFDTEPHDSETLETLRRSRELSSVPLRRRTKKQRSELEALWAEVGAGPASRQGTSSLAKELEILRQKYDL